MGLAKFNAWNDKDLVTLALSKVSDSAIFEIMSQAKFDAWNDKDLVVVALSRVYGFDDTKKVMGLAKFDAWNDKDLVKVALSKVSGLADTKEIMGIAKFDAWSDKELVKIALSNVSNLTDITGILALVKFDANNDKDILAITATTICEKISHMFLTKFVNSKTKTLSKTETDENKTEEGYGSPYYYPDVYETTEWEIIETKTIYGFDEAKADEILKGLPQQIIDEVKKRLTNETRTETTSNRGNMLNSKRTEKATQ